MKSLSTYSAVVMLCLAFLGHVQPKANQDIPDELFTFYSVVNGVFDNRAEIKAGATHHVFKKIRIIPMQLPLLSSFPVLFREEIHNGVVSILELGLITEYNHKSIYVVPYNFTDLKKYKPGAFKIADLANLTLAELHGDNNCIATIEPAGINIFEANWPDCRYMVGGQQLVYSITYTCDTITSVVSQAIPSTVAETPYIFTPLGKRFPLPVSSDYIYPCSN